LAQFPNAAVKDLFTMEFYSHLIGMLETYDNTIEIPSPLQKYLENIDSLPAPHKTRIQEMLHFLRDSIPVAHDDEEDEEADQEMHADCEDDDGDISEAEIGDDALGIPGFDGLGVFPVSAMSNHSCDPNAVVKYTRDYTHSLVATRNIAKGEEITHSYILNELPLQERRESLLEYGFLCDCPKCTREEPKAERVVNKLQS